MKLYTIVVSEHREDPPIHGSRNRESEALNLGVSTSCFIQRYSDKN